MYGYTMHMPASIDVYKAMHKAVVDIADEEDIKGLVLHLVHATDRGFALTEVWESKEQMEAFNRTVIPQARLIAQLPAEGPDPELEEFDPVVVISQAFNSDKAQDAGQ